MREALTPYAGSKVDLGIRPSDFELAREGINGIAAHVDSIEPLGDAYLIYVRIGEKVVEHRARQYGTTKFGGLERFINGPLDLMSISFVGKFGKRPMHFFGTLGLLCFLIGFGILTYLSIIKAFFQEWGIADRPLFFFGILALIIGSQLFLTGFLAEMINRNSPIRNHYLVEKEI